MTWTTLWLKLTARLRLPTVLCRKNTERSVFFLEVWVNQYISINECRGGYYRGRLGIRQAPPSLAFHGFLKFCGIKTPVKVVNIIAFNLIWTFARSPYISPIPRLFKKNFHSFSEMSRFNRGLNSRYQFEANSFLNCVVFTVTVLGLLSSNIIAIGHAFIKKCFIFLTQTLSLISLI